jgi:hypothetical protein
MMLFFLIRHSNSDADGLSLRFIHPKQRCIFRALCGCSAILFLISFAAAQTQFDGPAELPRVHVHSAIADTPAPGKVITVHAGDDLQAAIKNANCGDKIELQSGAEFAGLFRFPEKPCDDSHWIVVRTSAADSSLPPEGSRLTPCWAGVTSLPGRPDFHCAAAQNSLAKIEFNVKSGLGPLIFQQGANHYRFVGLEITRTAGPVVSALSVAPGGATANHLIFDRVWMHGTAQDETTRAINLNGMSHVAVVDSFFTDFHCIAITGSCTDAQVVAAGGGNVPTGPFKIVNNFLEASGENILFGGGPATMTPADIEIRGNFFFKPMTWKEGEPGFVAGASGRPFIVKNLFELKNAQRVLFEGNVLENCWGGFSQNGYAILLTPKNQANRCPLCRVTDVTIRYNLISNVGAVFEIANIRSDAGGETTAGERYSIHDVVAINVRGKEYGGSGLFAQLLVSAPPLHDVQIEHVTAFIPRAIFSITNTDKFANFKIENNILLTGQYSVLSAGGGPRNCAFQPDPGGFFKNCFSNSSFTHNLMIGEGGWPSGNPSAKDARSAGIREMREPFGRPYELCKGKEGDDCKKASPGLKAGTDGKDLGADLDKLSQMLANVK